MNPQIIIILKWKWSTLHQRLLQIGWKMLYEIMCHAGDILSTIMYLFYINSIEYVDQSALMY